MLSAWKAACFFGCVALASCGFASDGSTGDPPTDPDPSELGTGSRLHDLLQAPAWLQPGNMMSDGCKSPSDKKVNVTGQVIVGFDRYDETGDGALGNIYIEDLPVGGPALPYSGVTVFAPAFSPPDLRVFEGDVVDTFGNLSEFLGPTSGKFGDCKTLPEIGGTMTFRFDHGPIEPLDVVEDGTDDARWEPVLGYENARQYIGMLVRFKGVLVGTPADDGKGRYTAAISMGGGISADDVIKIDNELFDLEHDGPALDSVKFKSVAGIITYFYGFKLAPRSADDFEP